MSSIPFPITTQTATSSPKTSRSLTIKAYNEAVTTHLGNQQFPGDGKFWLVNQPSKHYKLTSRSRRTAIDHGSTPQNPFVFWPAHMVAGLVSDIVTEFGKIGQNIDPNALLAQSFNPVNDDHYAYIKKITAGQKKPGNRKSRGERQDAYTYESYVELIKALKGGRKSGVKKPKTKIVDQSELITKVNNMLAEAFAGRAPKNTKGSGDLAYVVNDYLNTGKGKPVKYSTNSAQFVYPQLRTNDGVIIIPIVASPTASIAYNAFIDNVVSRTNYAAYGEAIKQAFAAGVNQKQQAIARSPAAPVGFPGFPSNSGYNPSPANSPPRTLNLAPTNGVFIPGQFPSQFPTSQYPPA